METVSVTTANTVCIRQIINHNGYGKGMPYPLKNEIKIQIKGKLRPGNQ